jgi:hypothetical protein
VPAVEEVLDERDLPVVATSAPARPRRADLCALSSYAVLGVLVLIQLWIDPAGRVLSHNDDDHGFFAFAMAHGERVLFHGANPLFTDRMNVPDGVNMMANTTELALSVPMAPVTHWLGAGVTVVLLLTLGLAGTAFAWYWVLSRHLVQSRRAAWIGGLWCGFAPTMVSHANGHINFVSLFVVPFIVWQVLRLREPGRAVRGGIVLGLLVVVQVFLNEEILLFTALTLGAFVIAYAALAWHTVAGYARRFAAGLGVAMITALVPLAYPLWFQFAGPQSYSGQPFEPGKFVTDLLSLGAYARQSLAGNAAIARGLSVSPTEENTFFGVPMLVMLVVSVVLLWRDLAARAAAIAGLVLLIMSMGPELRVAGFDTGVPLPFALLARLPVLNLVSVTRFAMVPAMIIGVLLALAADRAPLLGRRRRIAFWAGLAVAIVPVLPKPLPVVAADPLPPFIAQQMWREYLPDDDRTLVTVPLPEVTTGRAGMRWFALSGLDYRVPRGYFMGPADPPLNRTGSWNAARRPTADLLRIAGAYGRMPVLTDADRQAAIADLTYWRAAVVVLVPGTPHHDLLAAILTDLLGRPARPVGGVQLWDVRDLATPSG